MATFWTKIEIEKVETEKSLDPPIGNVDVKFDLFAQDLKNRIIVDIQQHRVTTGVDDPSRGRETQSVLRCCARDDGFGG